MEAFRYRNLTSLLILFLLLSFLLTAPTVLQNIYTGSILGYDMLNSVSLNWWNLGGTLLGCAFAYYWHARLRGSFKVTIFIGFALIVASMLMMYYLIDPGTNIERLYLPTVLRGAGYIILYISLTVYVTGIVPFQHFFQVLSILGFVRTGFASAFGSAIYGRVLQYTLPGNFQNLTRELDGVNPVLNPQNFFQIYGEAMRQTTLVSLKEMYGWVCLVGIILLLVILSERFLNRSFIGRLPRIRRIKQLLKREITPA